MPDEINILSILVLGICFGMTLGIVYFSGLWITVKKIPFSSSPHRLLYSSLIVRLGMLLVSFYFLLIQGWQLFVAVVTGFLIARFYWFLLVNKSKPKTDHLVAGKLR